MDLEAFDHISISLEMSHANLDDSSNSDAQQSAPLADVMKSVVMQCLQHLPPDAFANFKNLGKKLAECSKPLKLSTLCSGTDSSVDLLQDPGMCAHCFGT